MYTISRVMPNIFEILFETDLENARRSLEIFHLNKSGFANVCFNGEKVFFYVSRVLYVKTSWNFINVIMRFHYV